MKKRICIFLIFCLLTLPLQPVFASTTINSDSAIFLNPEINQMYPADTPTELALLLKMLNNTLKMPEMTLTMNGQFELEFSVQEISRFYEIDESGILNVEFDLEAVYQQPDSLFIEIQLTIQDDFVGFENMENRKIQYYFTDNKLYQNFTFEDNSFFFPLNHYVLLEEIIEELMTYTPIVLEIPDEILIYLTAQQNLTTRYNKKINQLTFHITNDDFQEIIQNLFFYNAPYYSHLSEEETIESEYFKMVQDILNGIYCEFKATVQADNETNNINSIRVNFNLDAPFHIEMDKNITDGYFIINGKLTADIKNSIEGFTFPEIPVIFEEQ